MARLLVTNCTIDGDAGGVYLLETPSGALKRIHDQPSRGITRGPDGYYVVGHQGAVYRLDPDTWRSTPVADTGLKGSHDLRWFGGDEFYLVASYGNRVLRLDRGFRILDELRVVDSDEDVCHANCLVRLDGELLLSVFTLSPGRREEKRHGTAWRTEGKILRLDWPAKRFEVLHEPLCQPHSLVPRSGRLYCCESFTSEVSAVDVAADSRTPVKRLHGFVRGLEFAGGSAFVGISRTRKRMSPWQRLLERLRSWTGVVELDPETWRVRRRYSIPGSEVYEILPIDA